MRYSEKSDLLFWDNILPFYYNNKLRKQRTILWTKNILCAEDYKEFFLPYATKYSMSPILTESRRP